MTKKEYVKVLEERLKDNEEKIKELLKPLANYKTRKKYVLLTSANMWYKYKIQEVSKMKDEITYPDVLPPMPVILLTTYDDKKEEIKSLDKCLEEIGPKILGFEQEKITSQADYIYYNLIYYGCIDMKHWLQCSK